MNAPAGLGRLSCDFSWNFNKNVEHEILHIYKITKDSSEQHIQRHPLKSHCHLDVQVWSAIPSIQHFSVAFYISVDNNSLQMLLVFH